MLRFLRKIRKYLLSERMFSKYIMYALGEIVLVVIGILIALQIDAWNDERQRNEETHELLKQVHKELGFNIGKANITINEYRDYDTLVYKVLHKQATYDDYKKNGELSYFFFRANAVGMVNESYLSLIEKEKVFSIEQDSFIRRLRNIYGHIKSKVDDRDQLQLNMERNYIDKLRNNYDWYYDYTLMHEPKEEMIQYFLTSPLHLNEIAHYQIMNLQNHNGIALSFRNVAVELYVDLSKYLGIPADTTVTKAHINYDDCLGEYRRPDSPNEIYIIKKNGEYYKRAIKFQDTTVVRDDKIYPMTDNTFNCFTTFGRFEMDSANNVTSFLLSLGKYQYWYYKVKNLKEEDR